MNMNTDRNHEQGHSGMHLEPIEMLLQDHHMVRQLLEDEEEQQLFPKVRQSGVDMQSLGAEMMSFESSMVSEQAKT